uniref:BTB domain-containing protein n=1 Tax=Rhabditophanes sp. KR3021 TaxID=114890 RepID=A0AC35U2M5_9BILA
MSTPMRCPNYEKLAENNPFANAELILTNGTIKVSKIVLCYYSDYFYDLFMKDLTKDKFEIPQIELDHFNCYFEVMQKAETLLLDGEFIVKLTTIQKELQSPYLESLIVNWLDNNLEKSYLPIIYETACNILSQLLCQKTKMLIQDNFKELCTISSYVSLSYTNLNELFDNGFMQTQKQEDFLILFTEWFEHDLKNRKLSWIELLRKIDFRWIEYDYIVKTFMPKHPAICEISQAVAILFDAMKQQIVPVNYSGKNSKIFLFGGDNDNKSIVCYDIWNKTIGVVAQLNNPKDNHTSQRIRDTAFVFGGNQNTTIETFNVNTNICETISLEMPSKGYGLSSAALGNKIFAIGGYINKKKVDSVDYFEAGKMSWIKNGSPCKPVGYHDSVVVDEVIYVTPGDGCFNMQRFDDREGHFTLLKESPTKAYGSAVSLFNKNILCCGGYNDRNLNSCYLYDIVADDWMSIEKLPLKVGGQVVGSTVPLVVNGDPKTQFPELITADNFPLFPFLLFLLKSPRILVDQLNWGIELNPANKVAFASDLNIPVPGWGNFDLDGNLYTGHINTDTRVGMQVRPVNKLKIKPETLVLLGQNPAFRAARKKAKEVLIGKLPYNYEPLKCKPPYCNPFVQHTAVAVEFEEGDDTFFIGGIDFPMPIGPHYSASSYITLLSKNDFFKLTISF